MWQYVQLRSAEAGAQFKNITSQKYKCSPFQATQIEEAVCNDRLWDKNTLEGEWIATPHKQGPREKMLAFILYKATDFLKVTHSGSESSVGVI